MKLMRKLATVALLAVTVAVLVPGVASANEPYPGQTEVFPVDPAGILPDVCFQADGTIAPCDPYHEPVVTFPGIINLGNLLVDPPIIDPGLLFPVDPGTGEEAPDDDTPAEPPAAEEPSDDSAEGDAPVEESVTEEPHVHAPVTPETPATEVPATDAAPSDAASQTTPEAAVETTQSPEPKQVSGDSTDGGSQDADVTALEQLPAQSKGFPMWAALLAGFGGAFALFGSYVLGKKDV